MRRCGPRWRVGRTTDDDAGTETATTNPPHRPLGLVTLIVGTSRRMVTAG